MLVPSDHEDHLPIYIILQWYWAQCNSFDNHPDLAFTAGGGIRQLPFSFLPGKKTETLGLIGIHHNGTFYEIVPWTGKMDWKVWPWGRWEFRGRCTDSSGMQFEAKVVASTDLPGVLLRAPTKDEGMVRTETHLHLWYYFLEISSLTRWFCHSSNTSVETRALAM